MIRRRARFHRVVKKIGFLSFGHWYGVPALADARRRRTRCCSRSSSRSRPRSSGADGAYFRVHHFARQLALAVPAARRDRGAHQPDRDRHRRDRHALREPALHGRGRRRRRPHLRRPAAAGHQPGIARAGRRRLPLLRLRAGRGHRPTPTWPASTPRCSSRCSRARASREPNPRPMFPNPPGLLRIEPHSPGLRDRIWWGAGTRATAEWTAEQGMNLMSSTLLTEDTGVPFHQLQAEQIQRFRDAWTAAGHEREPRVSVSRSIFPIVSDLDRRVLRRRAGEHATRSAILDGGTARFGKTYAGEPDELVARARRGRGDRGRRHPAAHRAQPARRRLQRARARERPDARRARSSAGAEVAMRVPLQIQQTNGRQLAGQLSGPLRHFLATESGSALVLVVATVVALLWANSPWSAGYTATWETGRLRRARRARPRDEHRALDQRRPDGAVLLRHRPRGAPRPRHRRTHRPQPGRAAAAGRVRRHARAGAPVPADRAVGRGGRRVGRGDRDRHGLPARHARPVGPTSPPSCGSSCSRSPSSTTSSPSA